MAGESRKDFDSLLSGFRSALGPEGSMEEFLVSKLASLAWRYRRMLLAEQAEVQRAKEYFWLDESLRRDQEATAFLNARNDGKVVPGLILGIENPVILELCISQLRLLKRLIEWSGFNKERDMRLFRTVYGDCVLFSLFGVRSVPNYYGQCLSHSQLSEPERLKKGCPTPNECKANFLEELQKEIEQLESKKKVIAELAGPKEELEAICRNVPEGPRLDRLLRYESSLERQFDRTLTQLERLQRMRLGQAVLPKLEVQHSLS